MNEKRFIVGETLRDCYQIKCEKKDYSRVLAPNTVARLLNEQQATIKKLQDLCGESDGENAKLRIENKRLCDEIKLLKPTNVEQYEQIVQLQEENEQLKNKLNSDL